MKETIEEKIDRLIEQTTSSASTTTADVAQYKKKIGAKGTSKEETESSLVLKVSKNMDKVFDGLKDLVKQYEDRGVSLSTSPEGTAEITAPSHLIDEIRQKVEKRKEVEIQ